MGRYNYEDFRSASKKMPRTTTEERVSTTGGEMNLVGGEKKVREYTNPCTRPPSVPTLLEAGSQFTIRQWDRNQQTAGLT